MMGYAYYDTPRGPAGYDVADVCHQPDCEAKIDRGLAFLCGDSPGREDDAGCGWWYCSAHLVCTGRPGVQRCESCEARDLED